MTKQEKVLVAVLADIRAFEEQARRDLEEELRPINLLKSIGRTFADAGRTILGRDPKWG